VGCAAKARWITLGRMCEQQRQVREKAELQTGIHMVFFPWYSFMCFIVMILCISGLLMPPTPLQNNSEMAMISRHSYSQQELSKLVKNFYGILIALKVIAIAMFQFQLKQKKLQPQKQKQLNQQKQQLKEEGHLKLKQWNVIV
jgi:uncharacterized membrane protein YciS (DUF1049 family)